jgi:hypothetical protein
MVVVKTSMVTKLTHEFSNFAFCLALTETRRACGWQCPDGNPAQKTRSNLSKKRSASAQFNLKRDHAADRLSALHQFERVVISLSASHA